MTPGCVMRPSSSGRSVTSRQTPSTATGVVHKPRHFILYRRRADNRHVIDIARILRDDRDLVRHLPESFRREE